MNNTFYNYEEALKTPEEVTSLAFSFNNSYHSYTKELPDSRIKSLVNLEKLYIGGYEGERLDLPKELLDLPKLTQLSIETKSKTVPSLIWELKTLESLDISFDFFQGDELKTYELQNLEHFSFSSKDLERFPDEIFSSKGLKSLALASRNVTSITDKIGDLINLQRLFLGCENLLFFPESVENLFNLKEISLYSRELKSIPLNFKKLLKLENFRWGQCKQFPVNLVDAPNLNRANFDTSFFEVIESAELCFPKLKRLEMTVSRLKEIPNCLSTIKSLNHLQLGYNFLKVIDFNFSKLEYLEFIGLRYPEHIQNIDMNKLIKSLKTVPNLKSIDVTGFESQQIFRLENELLGVEVLYPR